MQQPTAAPDGALPPLALHELPDEALAVVCGFLSTTDLLGLALTSRAGLAIVEDAARRWLGERSEQERGWVPRLRGSLRRWEAGLSKQEGAGGDRECWLELMHAREVELLRSPGFQSSTCHDRAVSGRGSRDADGARGRQHKASRGK